MSSAVQKQSSGTTLQSLKRRKYMWAYLFIAPQLLLYIAFTLYPIVMSYVYAFFDWHGMGPLENFAGLDNFRLIFNDKNFWKAVNKSFIYIAGTITLGMPLSLLMALLLNSALIKGRVIFRTVYFIPVVSTTAIVGVIMRNIFGNDKALFNSLLMKFGIIDEPVRWLQQASSAMIILILVGFWIQFGMKMVYWLAALQTLPQDVYDAAAVDGSGPITTFRHITLPLLLPSAAVILLLSIVTGFNVFDLAKTLTGGGPFFATNTVDLYIYSLVFESAIPRIGHGSVAGIVFGFFVFALTALLALLVQVTRNRTEGKSANTKNEQRVVES